MAKPHRIIRHLVFALAALTLPIACGDTTQTPDAPRFGQLAGKTVTSSRQAITLNPDGTMSGMVGANLDRPLEGAWTVRDGPFCRTITTTDVLSANVPATECQAVTVVGDQATFTSPSGRSGTAALR